MVFEWKGHALASFIADCENEEKKRQIKIKIEIMIANIKEDRPKRH